MSTRTSSHWSSPLRGERPTAALTAITSNASGSGRVAARFASGPPRTLRLLHTTDGIVVSVSFAVPGAGRLTQAHELAGRLEDAILT